MPKPRERKRRGKGISPIDGSVRDKAAGVRAGTSEASGGASAGSVRDEAAGACADISETSGKVSASGVRSAADDARMTFWQLGTRKRIEDNIRDAERFSGIGNRGLAQLASVDGDDGRAADPAARRAGSAAEDGAAESAAAAAGGGTVCGS